ncbi:MAG TPA: nuclear transport factor 2 family protein [Candidatus Krumholzibacteria bacterium]|nr:nuclear transport factor 2 family protein [Candidatus Krumholzibacteria bacterium]
MTNPSPADPLGQHAIAFFRALSVHRLDLVDDFYAVDVHFEDPMVSLDGRDRMRSYYAQVYRNDPALRWEFPEVIGDPPSRSRGMVWIMHMQVDGLNGGRPISVPGMSRLIFDDDDRCIFHRDYFDMGAFVYENVPVLRNVVGYVKKKLHGEF